VTLFRCGGHFISLVSHYLSNIPRKNYNCIFVYVKVMPKILAVVSFVILTNLYFQIPKIVQQCNLDVVEIVICTL